MDAAFHKTILIVVLFAVFLGLANYFQYRVAPGSSRRLRHRRRRGSAPTPDGETDDAELAPEPPPGLLSRWSIWASGLALLLCILALVLMWMATLQGSLQGAP